MLLHRVLYFDGFYQITNPQPTFAQVPAYNFLNVSRKGREVVLQKNCNTGRILPDNVVVAMFGIVVKFCL